MDPSEAVFVFMGQAKDIDPHDDIKREILKRRINESAKNIDETNTSTVEALIEHLKESMQDKIEPAVWKKISQAT